MTVLFDYDLIKRQVVDFLENDSNWDNVVKLLCWESRQFTAHELYDVLTDLYVEGVKGAFPFVEENAEVDYLTIDEYVAAWMDGDF